LLEKLFLESWHHKDEREPIQAILKIPLGFQQNLKLFGGPTFKILSRPNVA
jgi:hypothetical protein